MSEVLTSAVPLKGGEFLVKDAHPETVFIPEEFDEEQLMIKQSVEDFVDNEVIPNMQRIEAKEEGLVPSLLVKLGELGLMSGHIPEEYGGFPLPTNTNTMIAEALGRTKSFSVSYAAHTGIGMLPILYYGTEEQKKKYLPGLCTGQLKAAYCLTEPGSGSDALAAKTRADLSPDGTKYIINGQKMWITNGGFADIFTVFAKIDGDKFTGFIVERDRAGVSVGAEEHKMGIHGSSTRQVYFENVEVPVENLLGEIGKGHLIAFNVLNVGRFKLGVLTTGGAKGSIQRAVQYANERIQFGVPIATFGAIKYKLAEQTIRTFALESSVYRVSQMLQARIDELKAKGVDVIQAKLEAAEEYAAECSILKVYGSEALDYIVDETVQIFGGMGFSEEAGAASDYRDSRINRIYEGTNEINRLLTMDMIIKRAMKGHINITDAAWAVQKELAGPPAMGQKPQGFFGDEVETLSNLKKMLLLVAGAAVKHQLDGQLNLKNEQEIIMNITDMATDVFLAESVLLRVRKLADLRGEQGVAVQNAILKVFFNDAQSRIVKNANDALASFAEGDVQKILLMGVKRFTKYPPVNVKNLRRVVADHVIEAGSYGL